MFYVYHVTRSRYKYKYSSLSVCQPEIILFPNDRNTGTGLLLIIRPLKIGLNFLDRSTRNWAGLSISTYMYVAL
jgi:hypothetical protein